MLNWLFLDLVDNDFRRLDILNKMRLTGVTLRDKASEYQQELSRKSDVTTQKTNITNLVEQLKIDQKSYIDLVKKTDAATPTAIAALNTASDLLSAKAKTIIRSTHL